ncbi:UNVERIFIED_CONTAM: hypothetical protein PYX00_002648 [Menopon gallinae]|uniref:G-protein coupled receptors family 1 profile domain-containing protein n=1 Tax=Menopon gallinae TaxID=328185 RepID=A0AAW2HXZ7_9NEOP
MGRVPYGWSEGNFTGTPYPSEIWVKKPTWEIAVKCCALLPVACLGIAGNAILLAATVKNRSLTTPTNLLVVNMAITDAATLLVNSWMFLVRDSFQNYVLGEFACNIEGFCEFSFLLTGVFNLIVISYNRLLAIVQPHEVHLTAKSVRFFMVATWILGFVSASPLIIFRTYKVRQWQDFLEICCEEDRKVLPLYWNVIISLIIWIPLAIMFACYSTIFYKLDKYEKKVLKRMNPLTVNYKKRVAKTFFVIITVFIICRVPITALVFWRSKLLQGKNPFTFGPGFANLWFTCHYLMFTNSALNPFLYGLTNESFRRGIKSVLLEGCPLWNKRREETSHPKVWTLSAKGAIGKFRVAGSGGRNGEVAGDHLPAGSFNLLVSEVSRADSRRPGRPTDGEAAASRR